MKRQLHGNMWQLDTADVNGGHCEERNGHYLDMKLYQQVNNRYTHAEVHIINPNPSSISPNDPSPSQEIGFTSHTNRDDLLIV